MLCQVGKPPKNNFCLWEKLTEQNLRLFCHCAIWTQFFPPSPKG